VTVYTPAITSLLEFPSEPEPAGVAPVGSGNSVGQFGGRLPLSDNDTEPSGVEMSKPLFASAVVVVDLSLLDVLLLLQPASTARPSTAAATAAKVRVRFDISGLLRIGRVLTYRRGRPTLVTSCDVLPIFSARESGPSS
jgi:hypothetical protein